MQPTVCDQILELADQLASELQTIRFFLFDQSDADDDEDDEETRNALIAVYDATSLIDVIREIAHDQQVAEILATERERPGAEARN